MLLWIQLKNIFFLRWILVSFPFVGSWHSARKRKLSWTEQLQASGWPLIWFWFCEMWDLSALTLLNKSLLRSELSTYLIPTKLPNKAYTENIRLSLRYRNISKLSFIQPSQRASVDRSGNSTSSRFSSTHWNLENDNECGENPIVLLSSDGPVYMGYNNTE